MIFFNLLFRLLTLTFLLVKPSLVQTSLRAEENLQYRLPDNIQPRNYDLTLTLRENFFEDKIFSGILDITIEALSETNNITLHANKLNFSNVTLLRGNETEIEEIESFQNIEVNSETDIFTLSTSETLRSGILYKLHFDYTGELRTDDMHGFYISKYTENNKDKYLATTQFQTIYARRAFPCFDEPRFKATFNIKINHPSYLNALGNTPRTSVNDNKTTLFEKTPPMSTYLVAFIVSEFTCEESTNYSHLIENVTHQICSRQKSASSRILALDVGPKILNKLEDFTGIKYSASEIPKLDQVAIPDFAAGAMENWGLATYRETALLWDTNESSNRYKQRVETVIAHELAHMWFGDLVTTHWWSDTFLNEGFATYFEYFITAEVEKDWELDKQFVIEEMHPVLQSDALVTTEPLSREVSTPTEVQARFSSISYNKGGSIFRMVEHFMGKEKFQQGLNKYLNDNKFGNTKPEDLWKALQVYSTLVDPLATVMHNWVNNPGYPLLIADNVNSDIIITQQRFLVSEGVTPNDTEKWYVPVSYTLSTEDNKFKNTLPRLWLKPSDSNLTLQETIKSEDDWIVLNNQQTGYYRVSYSNDLLKRISKALEKPGFDGIHELNRAQLVDDLYNLAKAGLKTYSEFLNFISFLRKDTSYFSWYSTITAFSSMLQRTGSEEIRSKLSNYLSDLIQVFYNQVPFHANKDDNQIYTHKKVLALNWACSLQISDCIKNSLALFNEYKSNNTVKPNKNLRSIVYCNGLRHSSSPNEDWDFLWNEFITTDLATEQATILTALGCVRDSTILTNYLDKSIDTASNIRPQDALSVFSAVYSGSRDGVDIAAEFLYKHYKRISEYYGTMNSMSSLINGLTNRFTNQQQINKLKDFVDKEDLNSDLKKAAQTAYQNALINLEITKKLENQLTNYFNTVAGASSKFELNFVILLVSPLWMIFTFNL